MSLGPHNTVATSAAEHHLLLEKLFTSLKNFRSCTKTHEGLVETQNLQS